MGHFNGSHIAHKPEIAGLPDLPSSDSLGPVALATDVQSDLSCPISEEAQWGFELWPLVLQPGILTKLCQIRALQ